MEVKEVEFEGTFIDSIEFMDLFRVKGKPGLFNLRSNMNKQGRLSVMAFLNPKETYVVNIKDLDCLGTYVFYTTDGKKINMKDCFTNLYNYATKTEDWAFENLDISELMNIIVPNYDSLQFKDYHAKKVFSWYLEVTTKVSAVIDEGKLKVDEDNSN